MAPEAPPQPFVVAELAGPQAGGWRQHLGVLAVAAAGLVLSLALAAVVRAREQGALQQEFERRALTLSSSLQTSFKLLEEVSSGLQAFFSASGGVGLASFEAFVAGTLQRHPSLYALEWLELVPQAQRASFEAAAREQGLGAFEITELLPDGTHATAAQRPEYLVVLYMAPTEPTALGFDALSRPSSLEAHQTARDTGQTVASDPFELFEDPTGGKVVGLYSPVYRPGRALDTVEQRRAALKGQAIGLFRVHDAAVRALQGLDITGVELELLDDAAPAAQQVLFRSAAAASSGAEVLSSSSRFSFGNRSWLVRVRAGRGYFAPADAWAGGVLALGLLVTALFAGVLSQRQRVERLREEVARARQAGPYTLERKLGEGGMGVVYLATHALLRRPTAVKLLQRGMKDPTSLQRFEKEVQITAGLTHPNTVAIYDFGRTPEGVFYYAMEYLDGITLDALVARVGPLPEGRVVGLLLQVCGALAEAHDRGLIHRDIKPSNLMVGVRGGVADVVKVLDFGLVKTVTDADTSFAGTPAYISPEAASGWPVDARSDLYALGAVGYFLLTACELFAAESTTEYVKYHREEPPQPPSQRLGRAVHAGLESLLLRALEKDPAQRPQTAREFAAALLALVDLPPWSAHDAQTWWAGYAAQQRGALTPPLHVDVQGRES